MSDIEKDLYILVGKYDASMKQIFNELKDINHNFEKNGEDHDHIKESLGSLQRESDNHELRIVHLEETGVPKRTQHKIDGGLVLGILNGLVTIIKAVFSIP